MTVDDLAAPEGVELEPMLFGKYYVNFKPLSVRMDISVPVLNLLSHGQECLLNVRRILCRRLEEGDVQLVGKFLDDSFSGVLRDIYSLMNPPLPRCTRRPSC